MVGYPVAHLIVELLQRTGREMHITEIANALNLSKESVSSSLNNRLENGSAGDVQRVRRGVWIYVEPQVEPIQAPEPEAVKKPDIPEVLEVLGVTSKYSLLVRDPDTMRIYEAKQI